MTPIRTWVVAALCLALSSQPAWSAKKAKSPRKPRASKVVTVKAVPSPPPVRHVFRCGNLYQASPCVNDSSKQIAVADSRNAEQVQQALQAKQRDQKQANAITKAQDKALRRAQKKRQVAIALSCPDWPKRPFDDCSTTGKNSANKTIGADKKMSKRIKATADTNDVHDTSPLPVRP